MKKKKNRGPFPIEYFFKIFVKIPQPFIFSCVYWLFETWKILKIETKKIFSVVRVIRVIGVIRVVRVIRVIRVVSRHLADLASVHINHIFV